MRHSPVAEPTRPRMNFPPPERRCTAICPARPSKPEHRCEAWAAPGLDQCRLHAGINHRIGPPPPQRQCTGHRSTDGARCPNWALQGQTVCRYHGGNAPQALNAAARRIAEATLEAKVTKLLAEHNVSPVENPLEELQGLAGEVRAMKDALGSLVNDLEEIRYESKTGEQLRAEVALFERAMERYGKLLVQIASLNLDERLVRIEEGKAAIVIAAVNAGLEHAGVRGQLATEACEIVARRLEAGRRS